MLTEWWAVVCTASQCLVFNAIGSPRKGFHLRVGSWKWWSIPRLLFSGRLLFQHLHHFHGLCQLWWAPGLLRWKLSLQDGCHFQLQLTNIPWCWFIVGPLQSSGQCVCMYWTGPVLKPFFLHEPLDHFLDPIANVHAQWLCVLLFTCCFVEYHYT